MFKIREIDHLVLRVLDLETTLAFYRDALGCTVERARDDIGLYQLRAGRSLIDIVPVSGRLGAMGGAAPGPEGRNLDHFCLRVEPFDAEAIAENWERLLAAATDNEIALDSETHDLAHEAIRKVRGRSCPATARKGTARRST